MALLKIKEQPETRITQLAFKLRLTQAERIALRQAAENNAEVADFIDLINSASYVDLTDQRTIDSLQQLEQSGLLQAGRSDQIRADPVKPIEQVGNGRGNGRGRS